MRIGNALRHAAEIELCLDHEGMERLTLSGPLTEAVKLGGRSGPERAYTISDNGRVEMVEAPHSARPLNDLLPADTDVVVVIADGSASLYTAQLTLMA